MNQFNPDPNWIHIIPFAALIAKEIPQNRPMATRLVEQSVVALVAAVGASYMTLSVTSAVQSAEISQLKKQVQDSENRLSGEIAEVRTQLYRK